MINPDEIMAVILLAILIAVAGHACRQDRVLDCMSMRGDLSRAGYEGCR